jgi:hypothetical protein
MATTTPNVEYTRDEVTAMTPRWNLIRDCLSGQKAVKDRDLATASSSTDTNRYLPKPNASDTSDDNLLRYQQYIERAVFYNVTQRTHAGLIGQVFQKEPVLELPALLEPMRADADGGGVGLLQQAKKALGFVLGHGRGGLLADYPKTGVPASRQDQLDGKLRPSIVLYDPWSIINWRTVTIGAQQVLSLVVISETYSATDDGFEVKYADQYRVLSLEEGGIYRVGLWRMPDGGTGVEEVEYANPTDAKGNNLRYIPFQFVGSLNNDPLVDLPPLYDLAVLNIAHYRNSADYEESSYMVGQPTPYAAGLTQAWVDKNFKKGVRLGSRAFVPLPSGGTCGLIQAAPNSMPKEAMESKERQMVALGAKLIEQHQVQRTATEARQEYATEISVLGTCAQNVASAYVRALEWCAAFVGAPEASTFSLAPDFDLGRLSAQDRAQLITEWQAKAISDTEMRDALKNAGVATQADEEWKSEVESRLDYSTPDLPTKTPTEPEPTT